RKAHAFQAGMEELYQARNPADHLIWREIRLSTTQPLTALAERVRDTLAVSVDQVRAKSNADDALKLWRSAVERNGVFVFKNSFKKAELSGFCLRHDQFRVIFKNNSTTKPGQVFSLMHDLAPLFLNQNGISRFDNREIDPPPPVDREIERYCNSVAA